MKSALRIGGLTLALLAALEAPAHAVYVQCYYFCVPDGRRTTGATYEECCYGASSGNFPCPNGSQGTPYGYMSPTGPQFC